MHDLAIRPRVFLHPGRIFASAEPHTVTTVLGSCVAVCLWDRLRGIGGMNHFQLAVAPAPEQASPRFGATAVERLVAEVLRLGGRLEDLAAKIVGGARVLPGLRTDGPHLGEQNVQLARRLLGERGIPVVVEEVGGTQGRKLLFHTDDGAGWVRALVIQE